MSVIDNRKYAGIMNLPHHVSPTRPQMPISDRAAQFSPFAALTGYAGVIRETARLTDRKIELDETMLHLLSSTAFRPEKSTAVHVRLRNSGRPW